MVDNQLVIYDSPTLTPLSERWAEDRYAEIGTVFMTRPEFVQRPNVNSMCDDFENVDQMILRDVAGRATKCGLTIERFEVVQNLRALVEAGLVKAYDLAPGTRDPFSGELQGMPPLDAPEEYFRTYFYPNPEGHGLAQGRSNVVAA